MNENKEITSKETNTIELELKLEGKWPVLSISDNVSLLGYPKAEFLKQGLEIGAIMPSDEFENINTKLHELLRSSIPQLEFKSKLYSKQGKLLSFSAIAFKNQENSVNLKINIIEEKTKVGDSLLAYKMASMIGRFYIFEYHIATGKLYVDWTITDVGSDNFNLKLNELPNWLDIIVEKDRPKLVKTIEQSVSAQCDIANLELEMNSPLGYKIQVVFSAKLFKNENGMPEKLVGVLTDISKHKQEIRKEEKMSKMLHTLLDIIRQRDLSRDEMLKYAMEKAIEFTGSKIGYIYLFNEKTNKFTLINWSREVMAQCKVTDPQTEYELEKTGIWGEVVRQRQPMILNDFSKPNDLVKGTPQGHITLTRWCAIPVIFEGKIVATLGVANADDDYKIQDVEILTQLMEGVWDYVVDKALSDEVESKQRTLSSYIDLAPMIVLSLGKNGKVININKPGAEILGGTQEDIIGKNWFDNFLPDSLAVQMRSVFEEISKGKELDDDVFTHEILTLQKKTKVILWRNVLLKDRIGNMEMVLSTGQDVTERENLVQKLQVSQGKFEKYIKSAPIGIYVINKLGQYTEVNESGCKFLGYTLQELLTKSISDTVADSDKQKVYEKFKDLSAQGQIEDQFLFKRKDGTLVVGSLNAVKIDDDTFIGFVVDITSQIRTSEELKKQNNELSQMNNLMIERELKMRELKTEIAALKAGKVV